MNIVDQYWKSLTASREERERFLESGDVIESRLVECKGSVLTDPLYDRLIQLNRDYVNYTVQELPHERGLLSGKFLHDNRFRAMEAIAAMANNPGGGIVLFGVVSRPEHGLSWDELLYPENSAMLEAGNLRKRVGILNEGIALGEKVLVSGIDQEMPGKKRQEAADRAGDMYLQAMFSDSSGLSLFCSNCEKDKGEARLWYCIGLYDFNRDEATGHNRVMDKECRTFLRNPRHDLPWPLVRTLPWRKARWCRQFRS